MEWSVKKSFLFVTNSTSPQIWIFLTGNIYEPFSLDNFDSSEGRAEFRVDKEDILLLVNALQVPEYFRCAHGRGKAVRGGRGSDLVKKVKST